MTFYKLQLGKKVEPFPYILAGTKTRVMSHKERDTEIPISQPIFALLDYQKFLWELDIHF